MNVSPQLAGFYQVCAIIVLFVAIFARIQKNRSLVRRCVTLFVLLHILCLFLWWENPAFVFLIAGTLILSAVELNRHYRLPWLLFTPIILLAAALCFAHTPGWAWLLVPVVIVSTMIFSRTRVVRESWFLILILFLLLVPAAVALIQIMAVDTKYIIALVVLLQFNDAAALLVGSKFGKHYPFKNISPNKTMEGYLAAAVAVALALWLLVFVIPVFTAIPWQWLATLGVMAFIIANTGDLLFSALKRQLNIKDYSTLLPGHGGMLDRLDNVYFSAPFFYFFITQAALQ